MVQCLGCYKKCKKVAVDNAGTREFLNEVYHHKCDNLHLKKFEKEKPKKRMIICRPELARNRKGEVI